MTREAVSRLRRTLTTLLTLMAVTPIFSSQQTDTAARGDSHGPGISLQGLLRFVQNYKGDTVPEAMVIKLIELHGLDFRPTPQDLARLKQSSASDALLQAVAAARKPPAKPVANDGHLAVVCAPVDCDVSVNGAPAGRTSHGLLPLITRPQGVVTVTAGSDRYDAVQGTQEARIRPDEIVRLEFQFKPSRAALLSAGASLLQKMFDSLGDEATGLSTFRATGSFYLQDAGGDRLAWSMKEWLQLADTARFDVSRFRERYQIARSEAGFLWKKRPKARERQEALEEAIRLIADCQLAKLVKQFREPGVTAVAVDLVPGIEHPPAYRVEGGPTAYLVTLDAAYRPSQIRIESPNPDAGLSILYSDYTERAGLRYPQTIQIVRPDGAGGVEARLDIGPADDSPYNRRKERFRR